MAVVYVSNNDPRLYIEVAPGKRAKVVKYEYESFGYPKDATRILFKIGDVIERDGLYFGGNLIGTVASTSPSTTPGYEWANLVEPLKVSISLYTVVKRYIEVQHQNIAKEVSYSTEYYDSRMSGDSSNTNKITAKRMTLGLARITAKNQQPTYATFRFKPKQVGEYKVRIVRKSSSSAVTYRTQDKLTLSNMSTRFDRSPIVTTKRHVFLEVKIRATNQLNGTVNNLSAVAESILDVYDPDTNTWTKQKTNNPAWVYCDILTGIINRRPLAKERLHMPSIVEWANFCDEIPTPPPLQSYVMKRFECNFVLDYDTTLQGLINTMTSAAQASLNIVDGKYGVLIDKMKTVPVQIFTPRNSWGFNSTRSYTETPHGLKIRYVNTAKNWEVSECIVYDDGYTELNATNFDELSTFACTNYEQAWRFGRYMLAQARLRKEVITISVDFEHLVCTRGDFVQITQDVMKVGGKPARVSTVDGNVVTIDDAIDAAGGIDYAYTYRSVEDGIQTSTCTVINSDTFQLDGGIPKVGDIIIVGESGKVTFDCIVRSITPNSDLSATLELVEKADDIYLAESSDIIGAYNPQLSLNVDAEEATPPAVQDLAIIANTWRVNGSSYVYYIDLDWDLPVGAAYDTFEVYVDNGTGYNLWDFTQKSSYEFIVEEKYLNNLHKFKVLAVSATGKKITLLEAPEVTATPLKKMTPPSDVGGLNINITDEVLQLDWPEVNDIDISEYLIRYSPRTDNANWTSSIPVARVDRNTTSTSVQARTGTYLIKAVDFNKNESANPGLAITTIPTLVNLNIIEETNDFPDLEGQRVTTELDGGLVLKKLVSTTPGTTEYYPEGYYYYKNFLDLGEVYTVRLQSQVEAEGLSIADLMSSWDTLADVPALSRAGQSEWDVETQYRATDKLNVISDWDPMSDVLSMSEGDTDIWTEWKKFTIGDVTGRIFQFRLKLISRVAHVTPRVFNGVIKADMPDRTESYVGISATSDGAEVLYSPPFKGPGTTPAISLTQDAAEQGDYFQFEYKNLNGFKIKFYDKNGVAVPRQFDALVKGYGRKATGTI